MNSQDQFYGGYVGSVNRSPSSTRPGYATVGLSSGMGGGRRNQPPLESLGQPPSSLYNDDRFSAFDTISRYDRGASNQGNQGGFMLGNNQTWNYNPASAATLNGPLNDGSRMRGGGSRRPALHTEWMSPSDSMGGQGNHGSQYPSMHGGNSHMGLANGGANDLFSMPPPPSHNMMGHDMRGYQDQKKDPSDLIPTAIVIKNIPFNIRKEVLAATMLEMNLPQPYAFNYHFDNGIFRGLAFANFQNAADTAIVIEHMNGFEIGGRKLRVEYKKMLPEHERERIEREKREKRGQLEEQHRAPSHQPSMTSLTGTTNPRPPVDRKPPSQQSPVGWSSSNPTGSIDMNDAKTLRYYVELFVFRNNVEQEVLIFPSETSPEDRRLVHVLAHNLGLEHTSMGEGENRQVHVRKTKFPMATHQPTGHLQQPGVGLHDHPRGLSRAATYDFAEQSRTQHHPSLQSLGRANLAVPGSPDGPHGMNGLRGVKSFADLRSFSPSPSPSVNSNNNNGLNVPSAGNHPGGGMPYMGHYGGDNSAFGHGLATPTTPGSGINPSAASADPSVLVNSLSSLGLGSSAYDVGSNDNLGGRARETPGAIGSQRPGATSAGSRASIPDRQPRGPAGNWESSGGFGGRGRTNGHMQRGSDSSDNTGRVGATSGSSALY